MTKLSPHLHFERFGSGPPILFLHGFLGSGHDFASEHGVASRLASDYECITVDLPGHGRSMFIDPEAYSFDAMARSVIDVLDECELPRCTLYGYSMGGRVALYLLAHYPDRFERAVLESASPGLVGDEERRGRVESDNAWRNKLLSGTLERFLAEWYAQPVFADVAADPLKRAQMINKRIDNNPIGLAMSLDCAGTGVMPPLWDSLDSIDLPLLLLVGERDAKFRTVVGEMATRCASAMVAVIANAGHNVHQDQPDAVVDHIQVMMKREL